MLRIKVSLRDFYDESISEFVKLPEGTELKLEHSLASVAEWESKWKKPFLTQDAKTSEETLDYIRCMTLNDEINEIVYQSLTDANLSEVSSYIQDDQTATWFSDKDNKRPGREIITSELIYYWMVAHTIPFECQYWHFSRLMTLIKVCNQKNASPKKMSKSEISSRNRELNAARRAKYNTNG